RMLVWFPEGERSLTGELIAFKPGVALLSENLSVPILPVFLDGTHDALPPGKFFPKFQKITVKFGHLVQPDQLPKKKKSEKEEKSENHILTALRAELEHLKSA